jgi:threonine/homoserine/homoserine lactone efflux protein
MQLNLSIGPLALFALVAAITPGPNNLLLMRSGARFGVRRSVPHMIGIQTGFLGLLLLSHLGVGALLLALPYAMQLLRWGCFAYLLWLALVILRDAHGETRTTSPADRMQQNARPMTAVEATLFQLINPKAWMMTITVVSGFYGGRDPTWLDLSVIAIICHSIGSTSMLVWAMWGAAIDTLLTRPRTRQSFGYCMAALVIATAIWMLY